MSASSSSSTNLLTSEEANGGVTVLPGVEDKYGGVVTEISHPIDPSAFSALLRTSLSNWTLQGKKGVWIKLPRHLIGLAETAVKEGFWFHHAEKDYLMLVYWIPKDDNTLPFNASHRVSIAAFVINHKKEVLVVQEKTGRTKGKGIWKFPTGVVNFHAAMGGGTGLNLFQRRFPTRCFDVGIAEQHAVTFAAGLACEGLKPFCAIYSSFMQRAYDQVVHDVDLQKLPVRFAMDRAGLVGADGPTHCGAFDVTFMACLPNMIVMAPSDEAELFNMVATASAIDDRPSCFRYPRGNGIGVALPPGNKGVPLEVGKGRILKEGERVALLGYGSAVQSCLGAAVMLQERGLNITVADARFCKPLDRALIRSLAKSHEVLITVEEGSIGGFGSHVVQFLALDGLLDGKLKVY